MEWIKLIDLPGNVVQIGSIMRVPTVYTYRGDWYPEAIVDLLVFNAQGFSKESATGMIAITGYKAGLINVIFPLASKPAQQFGLSKQWLIDKWTEWVYPAGNVQDVWIRLESQVLEMPDGSVPVPID
ncbi:Imm45 family immunity protein [Mitsuaria sp. 7]|uniref:Imm45 family immunity protein n=1 Tax=Mitsuaria sp. 7 TaxID=1658665 RepID=UPI0009ED089F|nr:Imm45 family immunity protein [Mitsuaria sp. 7]